MKQEIKELKTYSSLSKMLQYYLECRKNLKSKNPKAARTKNGRK